MTVRNNKIKTSMASKYYNVTIPGPFPDLLHDFAREILLERPNNVYQFGAQYFRSLQRGDTLAYDEEEEAEFEESNAFLEVPNVQMSKKQKSILSQSKHEHLTEYKEELEHK